MKTKGWCDYKALAPKNSIRLMLRKCLPRRSEVEVEAQLFVHQHAEVLLTSSSAGYATAKSGCGAVE
jgi:hypothetical protein